MGYPPTGRRMTINVIDICRSDNDGRIVEHWGVADVLGVLVQLGLIPPPGAR
jgi:predicted ester cyclase